MLSGSTHVLVVGLGNIPYPATRHSIGHLALDGLASRLGVSFSTSADPKGLTAIKRGVVVEGRNVTLTLFKPKAFMNVSGLPVAKALRNYNLSPSDMVVIHDSMDHRPLTISRKYGGSANGHNGVRSVIEALGGTKDFYRLRLGIGRGEEDPATYVLSPLSIAERVYWTQGEGADAVWSNLSKSFATIP